MAALTLDPDDAHLQEAAADLARRLRLLPGAVGSPAQLVSPDGETIDIPPALFELLAAVADELGQGHGVSLLPLHRQLTTTEAAQLLNVSRPHVISLLERGDLPFEKVGTHRRVRLADVLAYRQVQDQRRQEALANIVRQGEDLDLAVLTVAVAAVLDANVLYPIALAYFLLTTAGLGLYRAHWSPELLDEVGRNLATKRPDLTREQIAYRLGEMDRALPGACVEPPNSLVAEMTNDAKDRHVLALAVHVEAPVIVTFNIKDFPPEACTPHDVEIEHPDVFAAGLIVDSAVTVLAAIHEMAGRRMRPPASPEEVIDHLARCLPVAMRELRLRKSP